MLMPTVGSGGGGGGGGGAFTVNLTGLSLYGYRNGWGTITSSTSITAYTIGGVAPFTFEPEYVSGPLEMYPVTPTGPTSKFAIFSDLVPFTYEGAWRYKVTDALGSIEYSPSFGIYLETVMSGGGMYERGETV